MRIAWIGILLLVLAACSNESERAIQTKNVDKNVLFIIVDDLNTVLRHNIFVMEKQK